MSTKRIIIKNVISSWIYYVVQFGIGFFLMPFMVHRLGNELYGTWMLVLSLIGYMGLFDFRVRGSIVKYVAELSVKNDVNGLNRLVNTSFIMSNIVGLAIVIASIFIALFSPRIFHISQLLLKDFRIAVVLIGINIAFLVASEIFVGIIEGYKRQDIISGIEIIAYIIQSVLIVVLVLHGRGLVSLCMAMLLANLARNILRTIYAFRIFPLLKLSFSFVNREMFNKIARFSALLYFFDSTRNIIGALPNAILAALLGTPAITFYSIASRLIGYVTMFVSSGSGVLMPFISSFAALKDDARIKLSMFSGSKFFLIMISYFSIFFMVMGRQLITLWVGKDFVAKSYPTLCVLSLAAIFAPSAYLIIFTLKGLGRMRVLCFYSIAEVAGSLALCFLLINRLGILGVAIGFSIPFILNFGILSLRFLLQNIGVSFFHYLQKVFLPVILPMAVYFFVLLSMVMIFPANNYITLILEVLSSGTVYFIISFMFALDAFEKSIILQSISLLPRYNFGKL